MKKRLLLFTAFLLLAACQGSDYTAETRLPRTVAQLVGENGKKVSVLVEMADSPEERARGLMYRTSLPEGKGMLFLFQQPTKASFWMKNTKIPLDLLYFNEQRQLLSWYTMPLCPKDPCPLFAQDNVSFALEVPEGFVRANGFERAVRLKLPPETD
jgi:uncharacterized membrane protein (UPF0127 family)